jgi:hypothetical protein
MMLVVVGLIVVLREPQDDINGCYCWAIDPDFYRGDSALDLLADPK